MDKYAFIASLRRMADLEPGEGTAQMLYQLADRAQELISDVPQRFGKLKALNRLRIAAMELGVTVHIAAPKGSKKTELLMDLTTLVRQRKISVPDAPKTWVDEAIEAFRDGKYTIIGIDWAQADDATFDAVADKLIEGNLPMLKRLAEGHEPN
jgi:hypothetical protein